MKSNTIRALLFLALVICSSAVQVREKSDMARKHHHRYRRNTSTRKLHQMPTETKATLWEAIKNIFNKEDFRFTLGASLKLLGLVDFPFSVYIYFNNDADEAKRGWDWDYTPKKQTDVDAGLQKVKSAKESDYNAILRKYTDSATVAKLIVDAAEKTAKAFILDVLTTVAKAILIAIFPPLAPVFAIYTLIKSSGVYLTKDKEAEKKGKQDIYKLGYTYTLKIIKSPEVKVKLYVELTLNFKLLKEVLNAYKEKVIAWVEAQYDKLPAPVKTALSNAAAVVRQIKADIDDFILCLKEAYFSAKQAVVDAVAAIIDRVKETEIGKWALATASQFASDLPEYIDAAKAFWKDLKGAVSNAASNVVAWVKEAYNTTTSWLTSLGDDIVNFFKGIFSYRRIVMRANRRYFRMARLARRTRFHKKY